MLRINARACAFLFLACCVLPLAAQRPTPTKIKGGGPTPSAVLDNSAKLVGPYESTKMLRVVLGLQPPHMDEENQFLEDLQTKGSKDFHHFLTPDEWNARFAPSEQDEQAVVDWAKSQGLTVTQRYSNRLLVDLEGTVDTIQKAFGVKINTYQVGARTTFSNDRDPQIPTNLNYVIHSVGGLNNIQVLRPASKTVKEPTFTDYTPGDVFARGEEKGANGNRSKLPRQLKDKSGKVKPNITGGAYDPTDMYNSQAYDLNALNAQGHCCNPLGNSGVTPPESSIAIATAGTQDPNDFAGFHNSYPYLAYHYQQIYVDGTPTCCDGEGTMDFDWTTAMANSFGSFQNTAMIYMYDGVNNQFSTFTDVYNKILTDGAARVFSTSWGCEEFGCTPQSVMDTDHAIFNSMAGQGWTMVAASGDQGATAGCGDAIAVQYPASDPNIVGAGGTTLSLFSGPIYNYEVAWSGGPYGCSANDGGSTGGESAYYGVPSYQSSLGYGSRAVPDIALNADWVNTPQNMYFGGFLQGNGGTSIVAPEVAGFFAQENAYLDYISLQTGGSCNSHSCTPLGNANYYLYWFGTNPGYAPHYPYYDITSGCNNNDVTAKFGLGYWCTAIGYDPVTGWGSFNALQLARAINTYQAGDFGLPSTTFSGPTKNKWYNTDQNVSWTVADTGTSGLPATGISGFSQAWDSDPGDPFSAATPGAGNSFYSGPQFPNATSGYLALSWAGQGCHTANLRAWDNSGFSSNATYGPVCYDTVPPNTSKTITPTPNAAHWNKTSDSVKLNAFDTGGSGVLKSWYSVDQPSCSSGNLGACIQYTGSAFHITTEGMHVVYMFSEDVAGNFEPTEQGPAYIDETKPVTKAKLTGTLKSGVYTTPVKVTLTATDNLSGVASTKYSIDGGSSKTYTAPFTVSTNGTHKVTFESTDVAGNVEATESVTFKIQAATLTKTTTKLTSSLNPSHNGNSVTFTATVTATSGTPTGKVTFNDGTTKLGTGSINSGTHQATFKTSALAVGTHSITAVYAGNANFATSTSNVVKQVVKP